MKDDSQLIVAARQGDSGAFGELVQRYQVRLLNSIFHVLGNRDEAEDVVQEAFFQAFTKLETFQGHSAFFTWLYRIAFNYAISVERRKKVGARVEHERTAFQDGHDTAEAPADRVLREERAVHLHAALNALSHEHRTILILRDMDGVSYEAIGEILDLPPGTVRSRLSRARLQLIAELKKQPPGLFTGERQVFP